MSESSQSDSRSLLRSTARPSRLQGNNKCMNFDVLTQVKWNAQILNETSQLSPPCNRKMTLALHEKSCMLLTGLQNSFFPNVTEEFIFPSNKSCVVESLTVVRAKIEDVGTICKSFQRVFDPKTALSVIA